MQDILMIPNQQVFDRACLFIAKQGMKSVDESGMGRYRTKHEDQTLKCVVGDLISDNIYHESFEGNTFRVLMHRNEDVKNFFSQIDLDLLEHLQMAHDASDSLEDLKGMLTKTANAFGLDDSKIGEITRFSIPEFQTQ